MCFVLFFHSFKSIKLLFTSQKAPTAQDKGAETTRRPTKYSFGHERDGNKMC